MLVGSRVNDAPVISSCTVEILTRRYGKPAALNSNVLTRRLNFVTSQGVGVSVVFIARGSWVLLSLLRR